MSFDISEEIFKKGFEFNFFQSLWLIEKLLPSRGRIGTGDAYADESVRIETFNSFGFPAGDVAFITPYQDVKEQIDIMESNLMEALHPKWDGNTRFSDLIEKNGRVRMAVTFMGLYGVSSPLPSYFTDPISLQKKEYYQLKKFLDMFGHRVYSLFYRAWKKYRLSLNFSFPELDAPTKCLVGLTSQTMPTNEKTISSQMLQWIPLSGFTGGRVRTARGLEQMLEALFDFPKVKVKEFVLRWLSIPKKIRLGQDSLKLGHDTLLGAKMPDRLGAIEIEIGPLPKHVYKDLVFQSRELGSLAERVKDCVNRYLRDPLHFSIKAVLDTSEESSPFLGDSESQLGQNMWLGELPISEIYSYV